MPNAAAQAFAGQPLAGQPAAPQPGSAPQGAARFGNFKRSGGEDDVETPGASAEAGEEALAAVPQRDIRAARVAGLIAHDGRIAHLRLPTQDAGSWRAAVASVAGPKQEGGQRLLVVDAGTRSGAARILAAELAEDASVVLVDLTSLDRAGGAGLSELLSGDSTFGEIIDRDPGSNLHVVDAGRAGREAVLAAPDLLGLALAALSDAYDVVLVEASSRDVHRHVDVLTAHVDGALVLADQVSNGHAVETAYRLVEGLGQPVAIAVFDDAERVGLMAEAREPSAV
jgi:Mrp family chromosome partitioning ATPase